MSVLEPDPTLQHRVVVGGDVADGVDVGIAGPQARVDQDPAVDLDVTANAPRPRPITYALNNAFGFGGHNAATIFRRYDPEVS